MKRQTNKRKRTLCVAGLLCPCAMGSSVPQYIVRPAQRIVYYNSPLHIARSSLSQETRFQSLRDHDNIDNEKEFNNYRLLLLETDLNREELFWHVSANSFLDNDSVDQVFEELRQSYTLQSSNLNIRDGSEIRSVESKQVQNEKKFQANTKKSFLSSWFRKLLIYGNGTQELKSIFVADSEKYPVNNSTAGSTNKDTTSAVGFNVDSETRYNVSATIVYGDADESNTVTTANDTSTVIFTVSSPRNDTYMISNDTNNAFNDSAVGAAGTGDIENHNATITDDQNQTQTGLGNSVEENIFRPIRLRAFLSEVAGGGEHLTESQRFSLLQLMVRPAMLAWSAALRVIPVQGRLTVDPFQLHDGLTCGPDNDDLPSVAVPLQHTTEGLWNTDMIIYIGLAFTTSSNETTFDMEMGDNSTTAGYENTTYRTNTSRGAVDASDKEAAEEGGLRYLKRQHDDMEMLEQTLLDNPNVAIKVKQKCDGDYMAASTFCSTDQFDRPTAALLHLCIDETFFDESNLATNIRVIMHELGHALGFNAVSMAHFRRADGSPVTARTSTGAVPLTEINCTGPATQTSQRRGLVPLPSEEIVTFRTVRNGIRVAEVVTPSVAQVVRNHFDCQELPGAELESGEFLPLSTNPGEVSCLGDHWERRLFQTDLMNPLVDTETGTFNPYFSTLTLAYFADSGWYQVDLSRANYPSTWGRGAGCDFVEQPCVSEDGKVLPSYEPFFCTQKPGGDIDDEYSSIVQGCTTDLSRKASCSLGKYDGELPQEYQYFKYNYGADFGGNDPFMDYCPVYSGFANGLCSDSENEALIRVNVVERFGNRNSRCLSSRIQPATDLTVTADSSNSTDLTGLCMPIACVVEDRSLRIQVDGKWKICTEKDEALVTTIAHDVVTVICPDPIRICPTFYCQRDCLGRTDRRTVCDYKGGDCVCPNSTTTINGSGVCVSEIIASSMNSSSANGTENDEVVDQTQQSDRMFYDSNKNKSQLPDPDSPLADYYVPTARILSDEPSGLLEGKWIFLMAGCGTFLITILLLFGLKIRKGKQGADVGSPSTGADDEDGAEASFNPDKHKMMANVVVNLRMNDPALLRRTHQQDERASETDLSMTDTEGASACAVNDLSSVSVPPSTQSEIEDTSDEGSNHDASLHLYDNELQDTSPYGVDPLSQPAQQPAVVRRRHIPIFGNALRK